jgi:hypothetical protein
MTTLVKLLEPVENFITLKDEILEIVKSKLGSDNQISLQTSPDTVDDWYCSVGSVLRLKNTNERNYNIIQSELRGTNIEQMINKYGGYRTRIMVSKPRSCYSVHVDESYRIHIPIVTSKQSWMTWPHISHCYNLEEGNVYWTDTRRYHTVFNGSLEDRIHLVMCVSRPW